jgi:hypothetical protein
MNRSSSKIRRAINLMATVVILFSMARAQQDAPSGGQQSGGAVPAATGPDRKPPAFRPGFPVVRARIRSTQLSAFQSPAHRGGGHECNQ